MANGQSDIIVDISISIPLMEDCYPSHPSLDFLSL